MKRREPTIVGEAVTRSLPDARRSARLARLALVAAAAVPACHRGEAPTMTTAPVTDTIVTPPPPTPTPNVIAEARPLPAPPVMPSVPIAEARAVPPPVVAEQRPAMPQLPPGGIAEARANPTFSELRATPPGVIAEARPNGSAHRGRPPHTHRSELRPPYAEDMPAELMKPSRREK